NAYTVTTDNVVYLSSSSICISDCGSVNNEFSNFNDAINYLSLFRSSYGDTPTLLVREGVYLGQDNKEMQIDFNINIISTEGSERTIIDCENAGYGFYLYKSNSVTIKGFTIKQCVSGLGGAIQASNTRTDLEDIVFYSNNAREGSAIYSTSLNLNIQSCKFLKNQGDYALVVKDSFALIKFTKFIANTNDLLCFGQNSEIISLESVFGSKCSGGCEISDQNLLNVCGLSKLDTECNHDGVCDSQIENNDNCPTDCPTDSKHCNSDGICQLPFENLDNCPQDCNLLRLPGWKLESTDIFVEKPIQANTGLDLSNLLDVKYLELPVITSFMSNYYSPVTARLTSYVLPSFDSNYFKIKLVTKNIAVIMFVNNIVVFDGYFNGQNLQDMVYEKEIYLSNSQESFIEIQFTSTNEEKRELSLYWKEITISNTNINEYSLIPSYYKQQVSPTQPICGDGICNEQAETCFQDCFAQIQSQCNTKSPNEKQILPGLELMYHGYDISTGVVQPYPLLVKSCINPTYPVEYPNINTTFYSPSDLSIQISQKCTMDSKDAVQYSTDYELYENSLLRTESDSDTFKQLADLTKRVQMLKSDTYLKTIRVFLDEYYSPSKYFLFKKTLVCESYKVSRKSDESIQFSPQFLKDISSTYVKDNLEATIVNLKQLVKKYGTHTLVSATMGGQLEQYYNLNDNIKPDYKAIDMLFFKDITGKISSPITSTFTDSIDSKTTTSAQQTFESTTRKSTIIVQGGEPSSFSIQTPNAFNSWSQTIDLFPVATTEQSQFTFVSTLIPKEWTFGANQFSIKSIWKQAESRYLYDIFNSREKRFAPNAAEMDYTKSIFYVYPYPSNCLSPGIPFSLVSVNGAPIPPTKPLTSGNILFLDIQDSFDISSFQLSESFPTCQNIQFMNLLTSKSFRFSGSSKDYQIEIPQANTIIFNLDGLPVINASPTFSVTLYGKLGPHPVFSAPINLNSGNRAQVSFTLNTKIGSLYAMQISFNIATTSYYYNSFVTLTCSPTSLVPCNDISPKFSSSGAVYSKVYSTDNTPTSQDPISRILYPFGTDFSLK
ncbi:hypothetical protein CYY_009625, partial [Polysphondylium violaceum]